MNIKSRRLLLTFMLFFINPLLSAEFDHGLWNELLNKHVYKVGGGFSSVVDYQAIQNEHDKLKLYLNQMANIERHEFNRWTKHQQLAFLINAYNAWTIELILDEWPNIRSIKELGGFFNSPWSKKYITLFKNTYSLDDIEHQMIRKSGLYNEPRVHFALNCASLGCPALRNEAYQGDRLDYQLEEQTIRFLSDRNRNRVENNIFLLSPIFKWYQEDFEKGWKGFNRLEDFLLKYAEALSIDNGMKLTLKDGSAKIEFTAYDWSLNGR
jgi:hypothetical protein